MNFKRTGIPGIMMPFKQWKLPHLMKLTVYRMLWARRLLLWADLTAVVSWADCLVLRASQIVMWASQLKLWVTPPMLWATHGHWVTHRCSELPTWYCKLLTWYCELTTWICKLIAWCCELRKMLGYLVDFMSYLHGAVSYSPHTSHILSYVVSSFQMTWSCPVILRAAHLTLWAT